MLNSIFYVVNFLPLIRSIFAFYIVNSTSHMVNFYFFYGQVDFLCGQLFTFLSVSVKRRLQTGDKVQTEVKMQTESCRLEVKMQTRF